MVNGIITAGGDIGSGNSSGSGSGGTINILTDSISGAGTLRANGGGYQVGAGGGRVAITAVSNGLGGGQAVATGGVSSQGTAANGTVVVQ